MLYDRPPGNPQILSSWKEIAQFLGKGVRTVQRWEVTLGLPVRRPCARCRNIVMARREELEAWVSQAHRGPSHGPSQVLQTHHDLQVALSELRRSNGERQGLYQKVVSTQHELEEEFRKLKYLFMEWNTLQGDALAKSAPRRSEL